MEFHVNGYGEEIGRDQFISLQRLLKLNDGLWKSEKQRKFIFSKWTTDEEFVNDSWISKHINVQKSCKYIIIEGFVSFGHGMGKGHRPITYTYEVDHAGIKRRFRTRYQGNMRDGVSIKNVEVDWERTVEVPDLPQEEPEASQEEKMVPVSQWFGEIGKRYNALKLTVKFTTGFDTAYGYCFLNKMEDEEGNVFVWFSSNCLETGTTYTMNGTVKDHSEYNEVKQTVLTRCMKVKEVA
jgi:hypothetical protein